MSSAQLSDDLEKYLREQNLYINEKERRARVLILQDLNNIAAEWIRKTYPDHAKDLSDRNLCRVVHFGSYRLGVDSPGSDIDSCLITPKYVKKEDFFDGLYSSLRNNALITDCKAIPTAKVPIITMVYNNVDVDLSLAPLQRSSLDEDLDLTDNNILSGVDLPTQRALNGPRVSDTMLQLVHNKPVFRNALRAIKLWAKNRGIYSNALGYLGGVTWAIMLARVCIQFPSANVADILNKFFTFYSEWKWQEAVPISICEVEKPPHLRFFNWRPNNKEHMIVLTPCYPTMNSTYNVTISNLSVIVSEIKRAKEAMEAIFSDKEPISVLFKPLNFFNKFHTYIRISAVSQNRDDFLEFQGMIQSRLRSLIELLEKYNHTWRIIDQLQVKCDPVEYDDTFTSDFYLGINIIKTKEVTQKIDITQPVQEWIQANLEGGYKVVDGRKDKKLGDIVVSVHTKKSLPEDVKPQKSSRTRTRTEGDEDAKQRKE